MASIKEWDSTFKKNIKAVQAKLDIYEKDLARYDALIPRDKVLYKDRILDLRKRVEFYDDILYKFKHPEEVIKDEIIGDVYISGQVNSKDMVETEYGDFPVVYDKSKSELMDEYYEVMQNLNQLKGSDKANIETYKGLAQQYYFRYAALIQRAPRLRKGNVQNAFLNPGTEADYQKYVNEYNLTKRLSIYADEKREVLISKIHELKEQLMNFSSANSIEKNELRAEIAEIQYNIVALTAEHNKYEMLSEQALIKIQAVKGKISRDFCAYLLSKLDSDDRVNRELSNIDSFNAAMDKNDAELRVLALSEDVDEEERTTLIRHGETLRRMKDIAETDLSRARKSRLKKEILHAYNTDSISLEERNAKLALLDTYIFITEDVEKEISLYIHDTDTITEEEPEVAIKR